MTDTKVTTQSATYVIDETAKTLTRYALTVGLSAFEVAQLPDRRQEWRLSRVERLEIGEPALFWVWTPLDPYKSQWRRTTPVISIEEVPERQAEPSWQ